MALFIYTPIITLLLAFSVENDDIFPENVIFLYAGKICCSATKSNDIYCVTQFPFYIVKMGFVGCHNFFLFGNGESLQVSYPIYCIILYLKW